MNTNSGNTALQEIRFTVAGDDGTASFVGPAHAIKMFVAGCAQNPRSIRELLDFARPFDEQYFTSVVNGLASFDEHNLREDTAAIETEIMRKPHTELPPFRIYNEATRAASTQPARLGLIIFNLVARRIVQVQNQYAEIRRRDRGRIRQHGEPVKRLYHYRLGNNWSLVP